MKTKIIIMKIMKTEIMTIKIMMTKIMMTKIMLMTMMMMTTMMIMTMMMIMMAMIMMKTKIITIVIITLIIMTMLMMTIMLLFDYNNDNDCVQYLVCKESDPWPQICYCNAKHSTGCHLREHIILMDQFLETTLLLFITITITIITTTIIIMIRLEYPIGANMERTALKQQIQAFHTGNQLLTHTEPISKLRLSHTCRLRFHPTGNISFPDTYVRPTTEDLVTIPSGSVLYQVGTEKAKF